MRRRATDTSKLTTPPRVGEFGEDTVCGVLAHARSAPGHVDLTFEIDVSSAPEGVRYRSVAEVCGCADAGGSCSARRAVVHLRRSDRPAGSWASTVGDSRAYWLPNEGTGMALTLGRHRRTSRPLPGSGRTPGNRHRGYAATGHRFPGRLLLCTDGMALPAGSRFAASEAHRSSLCASVGRQPPRRGAIACRARPGRRGPRQRHCVAHPGRGVRVSRVDPMTD
jgi:hypothetical protein